MTSPPRQTSAAASRFIATTGGGEIVLAESRAVVKREPIRPVHSQTVPVKRRCRGCWTIWIDNPFTADYSWRPPNLAKVLISELPAGAAYRDPKPPGLKRALNDVDCGVLVLEPFEASGPDREVQIMCRHEPALVEDHDLKWRPKYAEELVEDFRLGGDVSVRSSREISDGDHGELEG